MIKTCTVMVVLAAAVLAGVEPRSERAGVALVDRRAERRVDVTIDGQPFTSYLYPASLQKPVLYPILTANGRAVTRGYPLEPRPGERADHPHHVGHWFNYGDVNGLDFWGHSDATPPAARAKAGTIVHREIAAVSEGLTRGELTVRADWNGPDGKTILREQTQFVFTGRSGLRTIDRTTTWSAADAPVTFGDTKEGAFGIRVARSLEHPSPEPAPLVAANGKDIVKRIDNTGVGGRYLSSDGTTGEAVWGTRGPWMALTGSLDGEPVTLAIFDHKSNHGHPTYWHARGYGLFAANPLGQRGYDPKQEAVTLTLPPGRSVTFRHRIVITSAHVPRERLAAAYEAYLAEDARR